MNAVQKAALDNSLSSSFTEEEAKHILNWYVGSAPISVLSGSNPPVGVVAAVKKLGGDVRTGWGVVKPPAYQPIDEV